MTLTFVLTKGGKDLGVPGGLRCWTEYGVRQRLCTSDTIFHESVSSQTVTQQWK